MAKKRGRQKTTPRIIASAKRAAEMIELRKSGATYATIGAHFKISAPTAWEIVDRALKAIKTEPAEQLKALEIERIDHMFTAIWANATAAPPELGQLDRSALESIVQAQGAAIRLMKRRAEMMGTDAPAKQEMGGPNGGPMEVMAYTDEMRVKALADFMAKTAKRDEKA